MSYILEALKRADAERGERAASGLPPTEDGALEPTSPARPSQRAMVLALAACTVLGLVAAGLWAWQLQHPAMIAPPGAVATNPRAATEAAPLAAVATPSPAETKAPEPPTTASPQPPTPVMPILAAPRPAPPPPAPVKRSAQAPQEAPETPQAAAAWATAPLSAAQRAALPRIDISGSSYSTNPDLRMLIANGKVLKEGQALSPGLTLEVIGPHSAVFNQSGTRFNINY